MLNAFSVWPENGEIFCLFLSLKSQWKETPLGFGLDYAGVHACINAQFVHRHDRRRVFADIQGMEFAASRVLGSD
ncbi:MAG: hypothetical protein DRQ44_11045 [Gammaproteobacteria bacterium]|nr:MAG: hypothetical protein DRQ44_11045 [Gammaproteobacteria bacterium]